MIGLFPLFVLGLLGFAYFIQIIFVMFVLLNPLDDKEYRFSNKKEFLINLIPFYFVYKKYRELEE
jgi:hypothetical protein